MKYFITLFLLLFAVSARAQITLEHTYYAPWSQFGLVEVDSGLWRYVAIDLKGDSISVFNLDHSLDRVMHIPIAGNIEVRFVTKRLFDLDSSYEYMVLLRDDPYGIRIFKENGNVVFSRDSCTLLGWYYTYDNSIIDDALAGMRATPLGTKLQLWRLHASRFEVYSLPGKLPPSSARLGIINASSSFADGIAPASAYPNPASGRVRIAYDLPQGVASGYITLTSEDGREMKRYHITNAFSDLLIEATDLPSGSYFYKLVTDKGESPAQRIVWMR